VGTRLKIFFRPRLGCDQQMMPIDTSMDVSRAVEESHDWIVEFLSLLRLERRCAARPMFFIDWKALEDESTMDVE
jgi:hypothetical protein